MKNLKNKLEKIKNEDLKDKIKKKKKDVFTKDNRKEL